MKRTQNILAIMLTVIVLFQIGFAYSQEAKIDVVSGYKEQGKILEHVTDSPLPDSYKSVSNTQYGMLSSLLEGIVPQIYEGYEDMIKDPEISLNTKLGLYGMVQLGNESLLGAQPSVDIKQHLAMQWIPGYDESKYTTWAQDQTETWVKYCNTITDDDTKSKCLSDCGKPTNAFDKITCARDAADEWENQELGEEVGETEETVVEDGLLNCSALKYNPYRDYCLEQCTSFVEGKVTSSHEEDQNCIKELIEIEEAADKTGLEDLRDETEAEMLERYEKSLDIEVEDKNKIAVSDGWDYLNKSGVRSLWGRMLAISYILFIVVMIIGGFMVMFRNKIGGQVAVTIFNTIPNVVIALLLATFSFAIVGLILNASVIASNIIKGFMGLGDDFLYVNNLVSLVQGGEATASPEAMLGDAFYALSFILDGVLAFLTGGISLIGTGVIAVGGWIIDGKVHSIGSLLVILIFVIAFVFISIRVFLTLMKAFLGIIVDTVFGPILITLSAIPGLDKLRKQWFNRLIKNALVFPLVLALINLPVYIRKIAENGALSLDMEILSAGDFSKGVLEGKSFLVSIFFGVLPFICYNAAANVPLLLEDFFPTQVGQGMAKFMAGASAPMSKIPIIGKAFKQEGK